MINIRIAALRHFLDPECAGIFEFNQRFDIVRNLYPVHLTRAKLAERANFMLEELHEFARHAGLMTFLDGAGNYSFVPYEDGADGADQDLAGQADALYDLVYVVKGTAVHLGLPWREGFDDVHAANMRKVLVEGLPGYKVRVGKPPGWVGPRGAEILAEHGYERSEWTADRKGGSVVPDHLCVGHDVAPTEPKSDDDCPF